MQYFGHSRGYFTIRWDGSFWMSGKKYLSGVKAKHPEVCNDPKYNPDDFICLPDGFRTFPYQQWENDPSGSI